MAETHKIRPMLWFDGKAEEAARFYVSLFPGSRFWRSRASGRPVPVRKAR